MSALRFLSYNLQGVTDVSTFLHIVSTSSANVVAVQGCTKLNVAELMRGMKKNNFVFEAFPENFDKPDGELFFSSFPILKKNYSILQKTNEKRAITIYVLQYCTIGTGGIPIPKEICVTTSKLEISSIPIKKAQIEELFSILHATKGIFGGDSSIEMWQDVVPSNDNIKDAWREKGSSTNANTYGNDRPDRFWYSTAIECTSYTAFKVHPDGKRLAVLAEFSFPV